MLVKTYSGKTILIDGGGNESNTYDIGENILLPYLLDKSISIIDYVMISHFDTDHCKGLFCILDKLKVKNVIISKQGEKTYNFKKFLEIINKKKINLIIVEANEKIQIDKQTCIKILFPNKKLIKEKVLNNNSIVAKICWNRKNKKEISILLTGDIEEIAEREILEQYKNSNILKSDILKVAHHGSNSSSIHEFLEKVKPKIAFIGVGEKNKFGHPSEDVIKRLKQIGCTIYRTDLDSTIVKKYK